MIRQFNPGDVIELSVEEAAETLPLLDKLGRQATEKRLHKAMRRGTPLEIVMGEGSGCRPGAAEVVMLMASEDGQGDRKYVAMLKQRGLLFAARIAVETGDAA